MSVAAGIATLLEKAATDNGFDLERRAEPGWRGFDSTHAPLTIWLSADAASCPLVALSRADVASELGGATRGGDASLPEGAHAVIRLPGVTEVHPLLRRAFQLANALPDGLLRRFRAKTTAMPKSTEAERLVIQRIGQDLFREGLLDYWDGRCAVTGLAIPELLRASHIKPWAVCTDEERLDVFNGFLLAPHLDAAFDRGFITVANDGRVVVSAELSDGDRSHLGLGGPLCVSRLAEGHRRYLAHHREVVFRRGAAGAAGA